MKRQRNLAPMLILLFGVLWQVHLGYATEPVTASPLKEGNVWTTADGKKFFTCPVMGGEGLVEEAPAFSDYEGVRYYHCCGACQEPFRSNPSKWLRKFAVPANIVMVDESGKYFMDPVDSTKGLVKSKTAFFDLDGKRYFFASKKTMKRFQDDPKAILDN
jgi:YHS domain-containing protein